jgi:hypothetical protein
MRKRRTNKGREFWKDPGRAYSERDLADAIYDAIQTRDEIRVVEDALEAGFLGVDHGLAVGAMDGGRFLVTVKRVRA